MTGVVCYYYYILSVSTHTPETQRAGAKHQTLEENPGDLGYTKH